MVSFYFSYGVFSSNSRTSYRFVDQGLLAESEKATHTGVHHALPNIHEDGYREGYEEDLAPGGDYIKLLLLPKPFSPNFRENWETYRMEYWEKENERRAVLRRKVTERDRAIAKEQGGWLWWTGYRGWNRGKTPDVEKTHHVHRSGRHDSHGKRVRSGSVRNGSHSRNSSRSVTPTTEDGEGNVRGPRVRSGSAASNGSEKRKKRSGSLRVQKMTLAVSRSATPDVPSPLIRENSVATVSSVDTEPVSDDNSVQETAQPGTNHTRLIGLAKASEQTNEPDIEDQTK